VSALAGCDVAAVDQAGRVLVGCADRTAEGVDACRRAGRATWRWRGPASRSFDAALGELQRRLTAIESAHAEAGDVVRGYAEALAEASERARRADVMDGEAADLSAAFRRVVAASATPVFGPDPGEAVRASAARLRREAADAEEIAASLAAAQLDGLADRAPRAPRLTGAGRFIDDLAGAASSSFVGLAQVGWLAGQSMGIGHREGAARHELWQTAKDSLAIWNIPGEIRHALQDDRPGLAVSAVAGAWGPGKLSTFDRHRLRDPQLAEKEAYREADRRAALAGHQIWRQTAEEMGRNGVDLINEEKRGGHTLREHVGVSRRAMADRVRRGWDAVSTFPNEATAQRAINTVLREHADELATLYGAQPGARLRLVSDVPDCLGRLLVRGSKRTVAATRVMVVVGTEGGEPLVLTAFPIQ
jgi:hypothetical protein